MWHYKRKAHETRYDFTIRNGKVSIKVVPEQFTQNGTRSINIAQKGNSE